MFVHPRGSFATQSNEALDSDDTKEVLFVM